MDPIQEGTFLSGGRWRGLDLSRSADDIAPGYLTVADNCQLSGEDLITRPGALGQLTTALGNPIRALTPFGTGAALFVSNGKLYKWSGGTTATEILKGGSSLALTSNAVQMAITLGVAFLVDGTSNLLRTDGSSASFLTELNRPDAPTIDTGSISLCDPAVIDAMLYSQWTMDSLSGAGTSFNTNLYGATYSFLGGDSTGTNIGQYWKTYNTPKTYTNADLATLPVLDNSKRWFRVDDPMDRALLTNDASGTQLYLINPYASNADWTENSSYKRYATRYDVSLDLIAVGTGAKPVWVKMQWFSSAPGTSDMQDTPLLEKSFSFSVSTLYRTERHTQRVDISDEITKGDPVYLRVFVQADPTSVVGTVGPYITNFEVVAIYCGLAQNTVGGISEFTLYAPTTLRANSTKGLWCVFKPSSAINLTRFQTIQLNMTQKGKWSAQPTFRLRFRNSGYNTWTSAEYELQDCPQIDISTMPDSIRSAVAAIAFELTGDVTITYTPGGRTAATPDYGVLFINSLSQTGNLPIGQPVWYKLVEMDSAGDAGLLNVVWSDGSPSTALLETQDAGRMGKITLPARKNSSAAYLALYRFGGTFVSVGQAADPTGHLVCLIDWSTGSFVFGADTDKGSAPRIVAFGNPYVAWTKSGSTGDAGSVIIDNTPDSWLISASTYLYGREKAPSAPSTIAAWDSRLWLGSGADLYSSWRLDGSSTAGIYWTRLSQPDDVDPDADKKGTWDRLLLAAVDSIQRLVALPGGVVVLSTQSVFVATWRRSMAHLTGNNTPRYVVQRLYDADASGVVASLAACELDGMAWWLARDGLRASDGQNVQRVGPELGVSLFSGDLSGAILSACPSSRRLLLYLAGNLYVFCAGRIENSDLERGWFRWTTPSARLGADIGGVMHLGGENGQLFKMSGTSGDKATPAASASPIAFAATTRRWLFGGALVHPGFMYFHVETTGAESLAFTVSGDGSDTDTFTQTISASGDWSWRKRVSRTCEGKKIQMGVSASAAAQMKLRGLQLEVLPWRNY